MRKSVSQYMNALRDSKSCGVWRRVVGRVFYDVSKEFSVFIFRVSTQDSENEGTKSLRNVGDYPTTWRHNPHYLNLQEQCCENLKPRKTFLIHDIWHSYGSACWMCRLATLRIVCGLGRWQQHLLSKLCHVIYLSCTTDRRRKIRADRRKLQNMPHSSTSHNSIP